MIRIGIECEQLEGERFGVGHTLAQLLDAATHVPGIEHKYRFVLYFKKEMPRDRFLTHPLFECHILTGGIPPHYLNEFHKPHPAAPHPECPPANNSFPSYMLP